MKALFFVFLNICRLRVGPQVLPASRFLLASVLGLHFIVGILLSLLGVTVTDALLSAASGTVLLVAFLYLLLAMRKNTARFLQAATAAAACEVLLGFLILPVTLWFYSGINQGLAGLVSVMIVFWSIAIMAHILRHALDVSMGTGIFFALAYMILNYMTANLIGV